ncbi:anti-repressor SinI family protein [Alkalihalobacillus sp. LMS39]|uniref:anti-repressor SinI family protein n=1 Tax=Alkalihalobacillus sp. LMS39 TaxID=2924032 RepID=UPI001FB20599|nr:anti-repressor SinI family protein [Alkalihalobacillus sp. LMS39]UOE92036.1 anti-repressor SinI family protein [Alkalihalobacillus sp. LMS39]
MKLEKKFGNGMEIPLDKEWITLIKQAKELGLSIQEIRNFLSKQERETQYQ